MARIPEVGCPGSVRNSPGTLSWDLGPESGPRRDPRLVMWGLGQKGRGWRLCRGRARMRWGERMA